MLSSLPSHPRSDGRPAYEPPILNYALQLDDEYQKQRDALLKYYEGDVGKTTKYLDTNVEHLLLLQYIGWVDEQKDDSSDAFKGDFWTGLMDNLRIDELEVLPEYQNLGITLCREKDGEWYVHTHGVDGRPRTGSEANAIKQSTRQRGKSHHPAAEDYQPSSKVVARRPQRLSCGLCRKRKMRCSGPRGEGATELGCYDCVLWGHDNCHFNRQKYPEDNQDTASEEIASAPRSRSATPPRPALILFNKSSSQTRQADSLTSLLSEWGDVATPRFGRPLQTVAYIRPMEVERQVQANEATRLESKSYDLTDNDGDYQPSSSTVTFRRPQRRDCGRCRLRKLRCSGPQGPGTTDRGCADCILGGHDDCYFNKSRYPEDRDDESENSVLFRPSSRTTKASSMTRSWVTESLVSDSDNVATSHLERSSQLAEYSRFMGYEPRVQANEATPLIGRWEDEGTRAPDTPWTAVFCGYFCN